ncbi:MAG: hypothetical protein K2O91_07490 [Lachnospiraceae bacterium]|nr:hypothetical protein [Lachnospiraceae bacterium]
MINFNESVPDNPSGLAIHFIGSEDQPVTQEAVDKLVQQIRNGQKHHIFCYCLSLDEYAEEDFLSIDMDNGWAALAFNTWDEEGDAHMYQPINPEYEDSEEDAPVQIGGQTPVLKRNALNDLDVAADCVLHFAKTGQLYPNIKWEEAD